jgi:hypothetical protein
VLKRWLPSILLCFSLFSSAEQTTNLYRVLVPVGDQSAKSRDSGIDQAFSSMLIKLSGDSQIMQSPLLQPFLTNPKAFLDSVGFSQVDTASLDSQNEMALDVKFDRTFVDKLLKQAQVPIVSTLRPNFLVWLMVDDLDHGRRVIHESLAQQADPEEPLYEVLSAFDQAMQGRAVSYFFPSYDLEDQLSVSANEAWALRADRLNKASQRYAADGWFAVRVFKASDGQVRGAWAYQEIGKRKMDDFQGESLAGLMANSVDAVLDTLLKPHTYVPQLETNRLLAQIEGVDNFSTYQSAETQLEKLEMIESLQLYSVNKDELVVAIETNVRADLLHAELLRSGFLEANKSSDNRSIGRLTYRWVNQ